MSTIVRSSARHIGCPASALCSCGIVPESAAAVAGTRIRVLIADDRTEFLRGLGVVLSTDGRIEVVGLAENGEEAIARALELVPDVVLMDVSMPVVNGIEATRVISQLVPIAKIIMLTSSDEGDHVYEAIKGGASGYLLKETSIQVVAEAIQAIAAGESLVTPGVASKLLKEFQKASNRGAEMVQYRVPRELEVLKLVAQGMSNRAIAKELSISENTVNNHMRNVIEKLHRGTR